MPALIFLRGYQQPFLLPHEQDKFGAFMARADHGYIQAQDAGGNEFHVAKNEVAGHAFIEQSKYDEAEAKRKADEEAKRKDHEDMMAARKTAADVAAVERERDAEKALRLEMTAKLDESVAVAATLAGRIAAIDAEGLWQRIKRVFRRAS